MPLDCPIVVAACPSAPRHSSVCRAMPSAATRASYTPGLETNLGHPVGYSRLLCPLQTPVGNALCEPRLPKQPGPPYEIDSFFSHGMPAGHAGLHEACQAAHRVVPVERIGDRGSPGCFCNLGSQEASGCQSYRPRPPYSATP
jgi:hypothetical protein